MALVKLPWPIVVRKDKFSALFNGGIYIGQPDAVDPITEPKDAIIIQEDGTQIPAEQPINIGVNGLPTYNGSVVAIDVTGDFSILIVDALGTQQYYYPSLGESSDLLVTDLRSVAFDLGLTFDDIGVKLVTDDVGTSLNNAEFILNTTTGEVWVLPTSIPAGSVVVSLSGSTLTTNNGDFELQSTSNDEYEIAPNRISVSQMVIEGTTGQPLPENGTLTSYAIGNEMAFGWVVTEEVVNGTKDGDGNVTAASGKVRYAINKDEKGLIGVEQLFGSVMQSDGANLTQVYADGSGITLGEDATTVWLEIDFSQSTGFFYVAGISEQRGRIEALPVNEIRRLSLVPIYLDGRISFNGNTSSTYGSNGNVSATIQKLSAGNYRLTFIEEMPDNSYVISGSTTQGTPVDTRVGVISTANKTTKTVDVRTPLNGDNGGAPAFADYAVVDVLITWGNAL